MSRFAGVERRVVVAPNFDWSVVDVFDYLATFGQLWTIFDYYWTLIRLTFGCMSGLLPFSVFKRHFSSAFGTFGFLARSWTLPL